MHVLLTIKFGLLTGISNSVLYRINHDKFHTNKFSPQNGNRLSLNLLKDSNSEDQNSSTK